jgi:imidazole glycerol-phosphate synthase subunit HisF
LRVVGDPQTLAAKYAKDADEILYMDVTASLYQKNQILGLIRATSLSDVWIPLTVGGGIRSVGDVKEALRAGADKVAINTAATERPALIDECVQAFGSQCIVGSVQVRPLGHTWHAYTNTGRDRYGNALVWIENLIRRGIGELLITAVDRDGTMSGMDTGILKEIPSDVPVVLSGGCGSVEDALKAFRAGADGVALGQWLHTGGDLGKMKADLESLGVEVRA